MRVFRNLALGGMAAALLGLAPLAAGAAPLDTAREIVADGSVQTSFSQFRGRRGGIARRGGFRQGGFARRGGFRQGGFGRRYGARGYGYRGYGYRRRGYGPGLGVGLAAGALIGGALAQAAAPPVTAYSGDVVAYCSQRFRSYDPASGTYLGYDGNRHSCP